MIRTLKNSTAYVMASIWRQLVCVLLIALVFGVFIFKRAFSVDVWWPVPTAVIFAGLFALSMLLLVIQQKFDAAELLIAAVCICCAMFARVALLPFESGDYKVYLSEWVSQLGGMSLKDALSTPTGNYNLPYVYFLAIISKTGGETLLNIKAFSCLFDVIMAYAVMKLVACGTDDKHMQLGSFLIILFSPTIMIDSAFWAQCDSVYVAFCIISIMAAIQGKGRLCAISWTAAFCFKLQAVFILPVMCVALFKGKVKLKHLFWIPAVYFISLLPAVLCGRSLLSCLSIYTNQMGQYKGLTFNAPSVWCFFGSPKSDAIMNMSLYLALGVLLAFTGYSLKFAKKIDDTQLLRLFFLAALLAPYILPNMHERYFYMAEILSIVYFMYDRKKWYIPAVITLSSLSSYMEYFAAFSMNSLEDYQSMINGLKPIYFAAAFFVILALEGKKLFHELRASEAPDEIV